LVQLGFALSRHNPQHSIEETDSSTSVSIEKKMGRQSQPHFESSLIFKEIVFQNNMHVLLPNDKELHRYFYSYSFGCHR